MLTTHLMDDGVSRAAMGPRVFAGRRDPVFPAVGRSVDDSEKLICSSSTCPSWVEGWEFLIPHSSFLIRTAGRAGR